MDLITGFTAYRLSFCSGHFHFLSSSFLCTVPCFITQSCPSLRDPMEPARLLCRWGFSRQEYRSGLPCPPPGDLPNQGIKPRSPASQVDSLPAEPQGKPKNPGVGSLSLLQQIFLTQELNQGLPHCRRILYQLSYQGSPYPCIFWALFLLFLAFLWVICIPFRFPSWLILECVGSVVVSLSRWLLQAYSRLCSLPESTGHCSTAVSEVWELHSCLDPSALPLVGYQCS